MSKQSYFPARGDIIHINFQPATGIEFTGPHFALVISSLPFSKATGLCIVLPATPKYHANLKLADSHLMVKLPKLPHLAQEGWVYVHQVKSIDFRERNAQFKTKIDDDNLDFLIDVMERVRAFIDPSSII